MRPEVIQHAPRNRIWKALYKDKVARYGIGFLLGLYLVIAMAGFIAPYSETFSDAELAYAAPTPVFIWADNRPQWPYVVAYHRKFDPETYGSVFYPDYSKRYPVQLFNQGEHYKLFGLFPLNIHLFGVQSPARLFILGTDISGQDNFSRLLYGGQVSLTIGFLGLIVAFPLGMLWGGISGYVGGKLDNAMMRFAEIVMSIPTFYLLVTLASALPSNINSKQRFAGIVVFLALIGWAGISRIIRGLVLSLKEQEYIESARSLGAGSLYIITRHILPQTATFIIIAATLSVPGYLLAESGLSFLGLGIQLPDASWGNMLREAQDLSNIMNRPWLLLAPGLLIFLTILAYNVIGDKLRDILDPKNHGRQV